MSKGRYGSSTIETAPWYWRKRKQQLAKAKRLNRAACRAQPERAPVEYDLPTGKTLRERAAAAEECSTERSRAPETQPVAPVEGRAWETPTNGGVNVHDQARVPRRADTKTGAAGASHRGGCRP